MVCRSVILCVQYIDVHPPSSLCFVLLPSLVSSSCLPPFPLLFSSPPQPPSYCPSFCRSLVLKSFSSFPPLWQQWTIIHYFQVVCVSSLCLSFCLLSLQNCICCSSNPVIYTHMPCHTSSYIPAVEHRRRQRRSFLQGTTVQ